MLFLGVCSLRYFVYPCHHCLQILNGWPQVRIDVECVGHPRIHLKFDLHANGTAAISKPTVKFALNAHPLDSRASA